VSPHADQTADQTALRTCIQRCAELPTERGRWQAERRCQASLQRPGTSPAIASTCAAAARRLGAWLHGVRA